jgi:hypothetical protein
MDDNYMANAMIHGIHEILPGNYVVDKIYVIKINKTNNLTGTPPAFGANSYPTDAAICRLGVKIRATEKTEKDLAKIINEERQRIFDEYIGKEIMITEYFSSKDVRDVILYTAMHVGIVDHEITRWIESISLSRSYATDSMMEKYRRIGVNRII